MRAVRFFSFFSSVGFSHSYLIGPDGGGDAVLIDPSVFDAPVLQAIESNRLRLRAILVTHAHEAHVRAIRAILKVYRVDIYSNQPSALEVPAHHVQQGDTLSLGGLRIDVLETPGHSIDSVCFHTADMVFTGDTLHAGGIGPTRDGYGRTLLLASIREKLLPLDDRTLLYSGHGPPSRIGVERKHNPYLRERL